MKTIPKKNNYPKVVTRPSKANKSFNSNVQVSTAPSKANKSLNKPATVSPRKH